MLSLLEGVEGRFSTTPQSFLVLVIRNGRCEGPFCSTSQRESSQTATTEVTYMRV